MKTTHENIEIIEQELKTLGLYDVSFDISDALILHLVHDVICPKQVNSYSTSKSSRQRAFKLQYDFTRRDLLKVKYKWNNNSASGLRQGYVYAITNKAFPEYIKIGSTIDVYDRLNSYQTSTPFRDYVLEKYFYSDDRLSAEKKIHNMFERNNEWCKVSIDVINHIFDFEHEKTRINLPADEDSKFNLNLLSTSLTVIKHTTPRAAIISYVKIGAQYILISIQVIRI